MIHEEICTYEVCKLAKEKGFDWMPSMYFHLGVESDLRVVGVNGANPNKIPHSPHISCPTQTQLQRWLREEKDIHIEIVATACGYFWIADKTNGTAITDSDILDRGTNEGGCFDTYELALEDALKYALENLV